MQSHIGSNKTFFYTQTRIYPTRTSTTMPKAAKCFASQRPRTTTLSDNPETIHVRELDHSRVGFAAEDHRIKTKFRTCLARARQVLRASTEQTDGSMDDREHMEARCTKMHEDTKLKELESVVAAWLTIVEKTDTIQLESDVEGSIDHDEKNDDQTFEYEEWNGIQDDMESDKNDEEIEDYSSEGWETEGNDGEEEEEQDENDDEFEDDIDVSDNEILYDKDGNFITEEDVREGLKQIMEHHMSKLRKRLDMYTALASTEDNGDGEEEPKE